MEAPCHVYDTCDDIVYSLWKHKVIRIKKKHVNQVLAEKEKFKIGFTKVLQETEGASEEKANEVVDQIWTIIENAANYMFQCFRKPASLQVSGRNRNLHGVIHVENVVNL